MKPHVPAVLRAWETFGRPNIQGPPTLRDAGSAMRLFPCCIKSGGDLVVVRVSTNVTGTRGCEGVGRENEDGDPGYWSLLDMIIICSFLATVPCQVPSWALPTQHLTKSERPGMPPPLVTGGAQRLREVERPVRGRPASTGGSKDSDDLTPSGAPGMPRGCGKPLGDSHLPRPAHPNTPRCGPSACRLSTRPPWVLF